MKAAYTWFGRFVGVANFLYGVWLVVATIVSLASGATYDPLWSVWVLLLIATIGAIASVVFLLTIDGSSTYRTKPHRRISWIVMFATVLLPSFVTIFLAPITGLRAGLLFIQPDPATAED